MAKLDLTQYGITGSTVIAHNPSYEFLFEEEMKPERLVSIPAVLLRISTSLTMHRAMTRYGGQQRDTRTTTTQ